MKNVCCENKGRAWPALHQTFLLILPLSSSLLHTGHFLTWEPGKPEDLSYCGQSSPSLISQGLLRLSSHDDNVDDDCGDDDVKDSYKFVKGNKILPPKPESKMRNGFENKD